MTLTIDNSQWIEIGTMLACACYITTAWCCQAYHGRMEIIQMQKTGENRSILAVFMLAMVLFTGSAIAADAKGGLFINLTTDDTWAATKAIMFAHQKVLKAGHKPVAIWLNVRAIYLADKKRASHVHGLMREKNVSIQDMLQGFIKDGGVVIACGACSKAAGLTQADYIDGIKMGSPDLVMGILFDPNVKTLSW